MLENYYFGGQLPLCLQINRFRYQVQNTKAMLCESSYDYAIH